MTAEAILTEVSTKDVYILEMGEAEAWADLQRSAHGDYRAALGIHVERIGGSIVLIAPGAPVILYNRVIGLGLAEPVTEHLVKEIIGCYQRHGVAQCLIHSNPLADQMGLPAMLLKHGITPLDNWTKMLRPATPFPLTSTQITVQHVQPQEAELFGKIACEGFGVPTIMVGGFRAAVGRAGWFHYLAFDGSVPISTAAMFVRDGIAWLGIASTRPTYRQRGGQSALFARRINDAVALGCHHLITETSEETPKHPNPSFGNMIRAGFRQAYLRRNYLLTFSR